MAKVLIFRQPERMNIPILSLQNNHFPNIDEAVSHRDGLVAMGGDLSPARLKSAYRLGIFPWFSDNQPILWWCLSPRTVLFPDQLHIGKSLGKTIRNTAYVVTMNTAFEKVIAACAATPRPNQDGTWITADMQRAYIRLHQQGVAHSFEYWCKDHSGSLKLGGGLYGVQIGRIFYGESMFAQTPNASKVAFVWAVDFLKKSGIYLIDCQMQTEHLMRFGAYQMPLKDFQAALSCYCDLPPLQSFQAQILRNNMD